MFCNTRFETVHVRYQNTALFHKNAKDFRASVANRRKFPKTKQIQCDCVGVSEYNRPVCIQYIHKNVGPKIQAEGYDPERPNVGYAIHLESPEKIAAFLKHNADIMLDQPELWPPILKDKMVYACLGGNHITITFRCCKHGVNSGSTGFVFRVGDDDELGEAVNEGHHYVVLREDTTPDEARLIHEWLNSDQNENAGNNEQELFKTCQLKLKTMVKPGQDSQQVKVGTVVAKIVQESVVKLMPNAVGAGTRWILEQVTW